MKKFHMGWFSANRNELFGLSMLQLFLFHFSENYWQAFDAGVVTKVQAGWHRFFVYFHDYVGSIGTEIFLILSGMGLWYSFSKNSDLNRFYKKRMRRVVVPYLIVAIPYWFIKDIILKHETFGKMLADLSFLSFFTDGVKSIWFIGLIIVMYLVFPFVYKAVGKGAHDLRNTVILIIALDAAMLIIRGFFPEFGADISIAFGRVPDFVLGVFMAKYIKEDRQMRMPAAVTWGVVLIAAGLAANRFATYDTYARLVTPFYALGVMIIFCVLLELLRNALKFRELLRLVGSYSLELYMCHVTIRSLMDIVGIDMYRISRFALMLVMAVFAAWLLKKADRALPA